MAQIMSFMNLEKGLDIKGYQAMDFKKDSREEKDPLSGERSFAKALEQVSEKINEREKEVVVEKDREPLKERLESKEKEMKPDIKGEGAKKDVQPEKIIGLKEAIAAPDIKKIQDQVKKILGQWKKAGIKPEEVKKLSEKLQKGMKLDEMIKELERLIKLLTLGAVSAENKSMGAGQDRDNLVKEIKTDLAQLKNLSQGLDRKSVV